jgi:hypothetical protein
LTDLTHPAAVTARLASIEEDLAIRQNALEEAGLAWFRAKREREKRRATEFIKAKAEGKTVSEAEAIAERWTCTIGVEEEAAWESQRAVVRVLDTRATIGQSLLKAMGRA